MGITMDMVPRLIRESRPFLYIASTLTMNRTQPLVCSSSVSSILLSTRAIIAEILQDFYTNFLIQ